MMHGYIPPHRFLPYLSWTEVDALPDKANTVIVLPVGAIEQHGPHLPCSVDSVISAGVLGKALEKLPAEVRAFGLAPITYGKSDEHLHFPGTMTLTGPTLLAMVQEIGESVYRAGFRKLLLANGHGGQPQVLEMAARELRLRHGDFIVIPQHTWRLPHVAGRYMAEKEKKLAMHAGHAETAIMLALAPDLVDVDAMVDADDEDRTGGLVFRYTAPSLSTNGVTGRPSEATTELGAKLVELTVTALADLVARGRIEEPPLGVAPAPRFGPTLDTTY